MGGAPWSLVESRHRPPSLMQDAPRRLDADPPRVPEALVGVAPAEKAAVERDATRADVHRPHEAAHGEVVEPLADVVRGRVRVRVGRERGEVGQEAQELLVRVDDEIGTASCRERVS